MTEARAWALREAWRDDGKPEYGLLVYVQSKVYVVGENTHPTQPEVVSWQVSSGDLWPSVSHLTYKASRRGQDGDESEEERQGTDVRRSCCTEPGSLDQSNHGRAST